MDCSVDDPDTEGLVERDLQMDTETLKELLAESEDLNRAGTRIWSAMESLHKATGNVSGELYTVYQNKEAVLFQGDISDDPIFILTISLKLIREPERMLGIVLNKSQELSSKYFDHNNPVQDNIHNDIRLIKKDSIFSPPKNQENIHTEGSHGIAPENDTTHNQSNLEFNIDPRNQAPESTPIYHGYEFICGKPNIEILENEGSQGQMVVIDRLPVTFKPGAQVSRKVHFSNLFFWAGEIRELSAWPVLYKIAQEFSTGEFGLAANYAHLHIMGEATTNDLIERRVWSSGNGGPQN